MDISDLRKKIDDVDRRMAALLNERATAVIEIGKIKREARMPIYEPDREKDVLANVQCSNAGPLKSRDLERIYERLLDVMRSIQAYEIVSESSPNDRKSELDSH